MRTAFVTTCIQRTRNNTKVISGCLTSICSLLLTTAPVIIVALDAVAYRSIGALLQHYRRVTVVQLPPLILPSAIQRNWTALNSIRGRQRSRNLPLESYSAYRFELWRLVAWEKLLYFDAADLLFLRNASSMLESSHAFSSIRVPWDANKPRCWPTPGTLLPIGTGAEATRARDYINMGVYVFRPSAAVADVLTSTYLSGRFVYCGGSDLSLGNQDVIRHLALETNLLGPFHTWPLCYNYRGNLRSWPEQRQCEPTELYLVHGPRRYWPQDLVLPDRKKVKVSELDALMRQRKCSPHHIDITPPARQ